MKKLFASLLVLSMLSMGIPAFASGTHGVDGDVSGRSVGAACLSKMLLTQF